MASPAHIELRRAASRAAERHERRRQMREYAFLVFAIILTALAAIVSLAGCAEAKDPANWKNMTGAAASAALDFAQCSEDGLTRLATGGAEAFTRDKMLSVAEACGVAAVVDGFAIFVAIFRDVSAIMKKHNAGAPSAPAEIPKGPS